MESKWYFFPGQTTENTKISDRAHALHITRSSWKNITQHLDRKKRIQETIDRERKYKEDLKKGSEAMTKAWVNSIENLRLKAEEERRTHIERQNADKIKFFYKLREEQEEIRKQYIEKVKKDIFRNTGYSRDLNSALVLSETLYEREQQKKFNDKIKQHELEVKRKFEEEILAKNAQDRREDEEKKKKAYEEMKKRGVMLQAQIKENEESIKALNRSNIEQDTLDRKNAEREFELIKQYELDEKKRKQREMAKDKKLEREEERRRQQILEKENLEMEQAVEFYDEAKKRIECMMKLKEKEMREEAIKQRDALAQKVAAMAEAKEEEEEARRLKVNAEVEAQEKLKLEEKEALKAKAVKDRREDRKQYLDRLEKEKQIENEMKRWQLLNRCKTHEALKEYDERRRKEKWEKVLEYRRDLFQQMAEDADVKRQEKEIDDILSHVSFAEEDKNFFEYANEVLELAKRKKRDTYPIEKVIQQYKKDHGMQPRTRRCTHKEHHLI